jgi:hypothetical protein
MGLLKSVNDTPGINFIDYRDQQFYGKYEYRARVKLENLRRAYYFTPTEFEARAKTGKFYGRLKQTELDSLRDNKDAIVKLLQFRVDNKKNKEVTVRMEYDTMAVFHNDLQFLHDTFDNIPGATVDYTQVETSGYAGIKAFAKQPKHKYRVYFKSKRVPENFRESVLKILAANKELRASPALKQWLKQTDGGGWRSWYFNYLSSNYFIDYNEESYLSYLSLMHGEHLGKKYQLQKRPDIV